MDHIPLRSQNKSERWDGSLANGGKKDTWREIKKSKKNEKERQRDQESNAETRRKPEESQERERNGDEGGEMQTIGLGNIMEGEKEERRERGKVLLWYSCPDPAKIHLKSTKQNQSPFLCTELHSQTETTVVWLPELLVKVATVGPCCIHNG